MGSDMYMNPPLKKYETRIVATDEVLDWVIGAMINEYEIIIYPASQEDAWVIKIFKGEWI